MTVWVSFFEIYGGKLYDLLNDRRKLVARADAKQVVNIVGLQETKARHSCAVMGDQFLRVGSAATFGDLASDVLDADERALTHQKMRGVHVDAVDDRHGVTVLTDRGCVDLKTFANFHGEHHTLDDRGRRGCAERHVSERSRLARDGNSARGVRGRNGSLASRWSLDGHRDLQSELRLRAGGRDDAYRTGAHPAHRQQHGRTI